MAGARLARGAGRGWLFGFVVLLCAFGVVGCSSPRDAESLSLEDAVGQMLLVGFRGTELDAETGALLADLSPGGVILFDFDVPSGGELPRNVTGPRQLRALIASLQAQAVIPFFVAIDAEGGLVNRLGTEYGFRLIVPSHETLGSLPVEATRVVAAALAAELSGLGVNWNLAPVVDVNVYPDSPAIGALGRSFSADPDVVAEHAAAFASAHIEAGVIPTLKHFPGHGSAVGDTHLGVTDVTDTYVQDVELAPYRQLLEQGYTGTVMTNHIVNRNLDGRAVPATLSRPVITGLLREELGYDGVVVSDDMQMGAIVEEFELEHAAVEAVKAGVDVILIAMQSSYDPAGIRRVKQAILQAVADGEIPETRIYGSAGRILQLKHDYGIVD